MSVIALDAGTLGQHAAGANAGFLLCGGSAFFHDAEQKWGSAFTRTLWEITEAELAEQVRLWPDVVKRCSSRRVAGWPNPETSSLIAADVLRAEEEDLRSQHRAQLAAGIDVELVEFRDALSLVVRTDGWCDPVQRLIRAREAALAAGALVFEHSRAELRGEPGAWVVTTSRASISAGVVLFATDAYLDEQLPELSGQVETWRLQMLAVREHATGFDTPTYMRNGFDYAVNSAHGLALGGLRDRHMHSESSSSFKRGATAASPLQDELTELARHLVAADVHIHRQWAAPVGYTRDGLPFVSEVRPGVWAVGAYNGHGNLLSYVLGKAVASALVGSNDRAIELLGR
jgi:glycine/D-amino acid oxidase-like deaminating enzyme